MTCPKCGGGMNHHADKLVHRDERDVVYEIHTCAECKHVEMSEPDDSQTRQR